MKRQDILNLISDNMEIDKASGQFIVNYEKFSTAMLKAIEQDEKSKAKTIVDTAEDLLCKKLLKDDAVIKDLRLQFC